MTLQFASIALKNEDFKSRCVLSIAALAANKIVNKVVMTPFEESHAKAVLKDPLNFASQVTPVMLQVATMHAKDCTVTMPTDSEFTAAASVVWPYLISLNG